MSFLFYFTEFGKEYFQKHLEFQNSWMHTYAKIKTQYRTRLSGGKCKNYAAQDQSLKTDL